MLLGSAVLALLPVALQYFGTGWKVVHRDEAAGDGGVR
jgi:hypothetical protein